MYAPVRRFFQPLKISNIEEMTICKNTGVYLNPVITGGVAPYTYQWYKNGEIIDTEYALQAAYPTPGVDAVDSPNGTTNIYKLVVQDNLGNTAYNEFAVSVPPTLTLVNGNIQTISAFENTSVTLQVETTGGRLPLTYRWRKNLSQIISEATTDTFVVPASEVTGNGVVYDVRVTDVCNTSITKTFTINVVEPLTIDDISPTEMCPGDVVLIAPNIHGGVEPYSCQWYKDNTLLQGENDEFYQTLQADSTPGSTNNYKIVVTDGVGTTANNTFTTFVADALSVSVVDPMRTIMPGWTTNIRPSVSGGRSPYTRKWYKDNDNTTVIYTGQGYTTPSADAVAGQIHTYRMVVTDACRNTAQVICTVQTADNLSVSLPNDITTQPNRAYFLEAEVTGGIAPYTYQWYKNDTAIQGETTSIYTTSNADAVSGTSNTYKLVVTDSRGNTAYDECTITCS